MDTQQILFSVLAILLISLVSLLGVILVNRVLIKRAGLIYIMVSLAAGTMLGDVFFHILPETIEPQKALSGLPIIIGIITFFILEHILHWHHHHDQGIHPVAISNLVADGLHNILDGAVIAAGFAASVEIGIAITIAVGLHEIPQEISDFAILVKSGISNSKAIFINFITTLLSIVGAISVLVIGGFTPEVFNFLLGFAGGGFVYIAVADLLPQLHHESKSRVKSTAQLIAVLVGLGLMYLLTLLE